MEPSFDIETYFFVWTVSHYFGCICWRCCFLFFLCLVFHFLFWYFVCARSGGGFFLICLWYVNWNIIASRRLIFLPFSIWYRNLLQVWNLIRQKCSTPHLLFSEWFNGRGNCKQGARGVSARACYTMCIYFMILWEKLFQVKLQQRCKELLIINDLCCRGSFFFIHAFLYDG